MLPLELDGKTPWPSTKANYRYQQMRDEIVAELRARDLANGVPEGGKISRIEKDSSGAERLVIDPVLQSVVHSGEETNDLLYDRWWAFCESPQDSSQVRLPRPARRRTRFNADSVIAGKAIEPKRGPGRPRKEQMQAV